ncbi:MAG TPA: hypothetical protein VD906_05965 [Caulobacteraceae bacterium]|nr:hypothetical protein [Caulobacteraceae bacterium]
MHRLGHPAQHRILQLLGAPLGILVILLVVLIASTSSAAAMTFKMTSGGECGTRTCMSGSGEIGDHTANDFAAFIKANNIRPGALLVLDSPGGNLTQGLALGGKIRRAGVSTTVQVPGGACASACVYAFLGGVERTVAKGAKLGVHQVYGRGGASVALQVSDTQLLLSLVATHIRRMGASMDVFTLALGTPPESMYWMSSSELSRFAVVTA